MRSSVQRRVRHIIYPPAVAHQPARYHRCSYVTVEDVYVNKISADKLGDDMPPYGKIQCNTALIETTNIFAWL